VGLSPDQVTDGCRLYHNGWSLARLGEKFGVDDMTVRRYLLLAGVVMRSRHRTGGGKAKENSRRSLSLFDAARTHPGSVGEHIPSPIDEQPPRLCTGRQLPEEHTASAIPGRASHGQNRFKP
jgi:hypothetical protein